jgi:hypothetical protein
VWVRSATQWCSGWRWRWRYLNLVSALTKPLYQVFLWVGPQCNAVVQRMALALAGDYIQQAPDGRNKQLQVPV